MDEVEKETLLSGEDEDFSPELEPRESDKQTHCVRGSGVNEENNLLCVKRVLKSWPVVELKKLIKLSFPTILMLFFQQFVYISAVLFAGHISGSSLELDAVSLAISVTNVTGFTLIFGLAAAADTLCSQSFGYKNYKHVGEVLQQGVLILSIAAFPVVAIWLNAESILLLLRQPPCVVQQASQFIRIFILALPPLIGMVMMQKYLQAQSVVWVFALSGLLYNLFTVLFCSLFIYGFHQDVYSIALAIVLGAYLSLLFLIIYVKVRGLHKLTWGGWSFKSLENWWLFLKLGLPGFLTLAFEWCTFEISMFVSGSLGKTALGVNVILLQLLTILFMLPLGMGTAASVRVGNELGAGNARKAKRSGYIAVAFQFIIVSCLVVVLGLCHNVVARIFTEDEAVIQETSYTIYTTLAVLFFDHIQGTIAGVFRGAGLQVITAVINFFVYYVVGLPIGVCLALLTSLGTLGMWIGLTIGIMAQCFIYVIILFTLNWNKLAEKAMKNVGGSPLATSSEGSPDSHHHAREALASPPHLSSLSNGDVPLTSYKNKEEPLVSEEEAESLISDEEKVESLILEEEVESLILEEEVESAISRKAEPVSAEKNKTLNAEQTGAGSLRRRRVRLLLCRGAIVLVGVCLVVVSGILAGLFTHPELDSCPGNDNSTCCSPPNTTSTNWTISPTSAVMASSCVCSSSSVTLAPTPLP